MDECSGSSGPKAEHCIRDPTKTKASATFLFCRERTLITEKRPVNALRDSSASLQVKNRHRFFVAMASVENNLEEGRAQFPAEVRCPPRARGPKSPSRTRTCARARPHSSALALLLPLQPDAFLCASAVGTGDVAAHPHRARPAREEGQEGQEATRAVGWGCAASCACTGSSPRGRHACGDALCSSAMRCCALFVVVVEHTRGSFGSALKCVSSMVSSDACHACHVVRVARVPVHAGT